MNAELPNTIPAPPMAHTAHVLGRLRAEMNEQEMSALITFSAPNIFYVTGWPSSTAYRNAACASASIVFADPALGRILVESDFRAPGCPRGDDLEIISFPIWTYLDDPYDIAGASLDRNLSPEASVHSVVSRIVSALDSRGVSGRVGVDRDGLSADAWQILDDLCDSKRGLDLVSAGETFLHARSVKSAWEIDNLVAAHGVTQNALLRCREFVEVGITVKQLKREFVRACWDDDRTTEVRFANLQIGPDFSPVYYLDRDRRAESGDLVDMDAGAEVQGYGADIARTWSIGAPGKKALEVHGQLEAGHRVLSEAISIGRPLSDVFEETMAAVKASGLTGYTRGHTGHSVGLSRAIEEAPQISASTPAHVQPGMVLCLETPYYGYGVGAMNVEDMVVVRDDGPEVLTQNLPYGLGKL